MSTKLAEDIMIPLDKYPHISHSSNLRQAVDFIEEAELDVNRRKSLPRSLLVFDEHQHLLGILRRRDILRGLEPNFLKTMSIPERRGLFNIEIDVNLVDLSTGKIGEAIQEQAEILVTEVMSMIIATVNCDDHLAKLIHKILTRDVSLLPVLKEGKVIGVVRTVDIMHEIADLLL